MLIGKKWKVESDRDNIILFKSHRSKKTGEEKWSKEGYFSTLGNALKALVDREVGETGLVDFRTVVGKQAELYKLIKEIPK